MEKEKKGECISVLYRMINSNIAIGYFTGVLELYNNKMKNAYLTITLFDNEIIDLYQDKANSNKLMVSNRNNCIIIDLVKQSLIGIIQVDDINEIIHLSKMRFAFITKNNIQVWNIETMTVISQFIANSLCTYGSGAKIYGSKFIFEESYNGSSIEREIHDMNYIPILSTIQEPAVSNISQIQSEEYLTYMSSSDEEVDNEIKKIPVRKENNLFLKAIKNKKANKHSNNNTDKLYYLWNRDCIIVKSTAANIKSIPKYKSKAEFLNYVDPSQYYFRFYIGMLNNHNYVNKKGFNTQGISEFILKNLNSIRVVYLMEPSPEVTVFEKVKDLINSVYIPISNYKYQKEAIHPNHLIIVDGKYKKCFMIITTDKRNIGDKLIRLNHHRFAFIHQKKDVLLLDLNNYSFTQLEKNDSNQIIKVVPYEEQFIIATTTNNDILLWEINTTQMIRSLHLDTMIQCIMPIDNYLCLFAVQSDDNKTIIKQIAIK